MSDAVKVQRAHGRCNVDARKSAGVKKHLLRHVLLHCSSSRSLRRRTTQLHILFDVLLIAVLYVFLRRTTTTGGGGGGGSKGQPLVLPTGMPRQDGGSEGGTFHGCRQYAGSISKTNLSSVKMVGQLDYDVDEPFFTRYIQNSIRRTIMANPTFNYVILSESLHVLSSLKAFTFGVPTDLWHCCSVTYDTPFFIGSLYNGTKIVSSVDDIFPRWNFHCQFEKGGEQSQQYDVYTLSRADVAAGDHGTGMEIGKITRTCSEYRRYGSFDGFVFQDIPMQALEWMKFSRSYWGAENIAAYALKRHNATLKSMCPHYFPLHVDHPRRERIRINHRENSEMKPEDSDATCFDSD